MCGTDRWPPSSAGLWVEVHAALDTAKLRLDELNQNIDTITNNIMSAGGN